MKKLIIIPILFLGVSVFGQANLKYVNSPDTFMVLDINTGDTIFQVDTTNGAVFSDGTTSKGINQRLNDTITLNAAMQQVDSVVISTLFVLPQFPSDPPTSTARMYYNTTTNRPRFSNGTIWIEL